MESSNQMTESTKMHSKCDSSHNDKGYLSQKISNPYKKPTADSAFKERDKTNNGMDEQSNNNHKVCQSNRSNSQLAKSTPKLNNGKFSSQIECDGKKTRFIQKFQKLFCTSNHQRKPVVLLYEIREWINKQPSSELNCGKMQQLHRSLEQRCQYAYNTKLSQSAKKLWNNMQRHLEPISNQEGSQNGINTPTIQIPITTVPKHFNLSQSANINTYERKREIS